MIDPDDPPLPAHRGPRARRLALGERLEARVLARVARWREERDR